MARSERNGKICTASATLRKTRPGHVEPRSARVGAGLRVAARRVKQRRTIPASRRPHACTSTGRELGEIDGRAFTNSDQKKELGALRIELN
jgi:hypothetical protein